jgi:geranylgeranyl diphosphate synthase type 3
MTEIYIEEMTNLHLGQGWDILWHNIEQLNGKYPTENDYLQMTAHKTGVLARLSARLVCTALNISEK